MCEVVGGGIVAGQELQRCVGREQVLQGLEGEGDCVCVCVDYLVLVTTLFPGSPAMEGGTSKCSPPPY